jgi:putative chitinase
MSALRHGDRGPAVAALQRALQKHVPNHIVDDGIFGTATELAVMTFQANAGLKADGIVGPLTSAALGLGAAAIPSSEKDWVIAMSKAIFAKRHWPHVEANAPLLWAALVKFGLGDEQMLLYALATVCVETGDFNPRSEGISRYNTAPGGKPFALYDNRSSLGNRGAGDGARFKGRGLIQLTGRDNYTRFGQKIGIKLVDNPERANEPLIAAEVFAAFLKDRESRLRNSLQRGRMSTARAAVNGGTIGLSEFTHAYETGKSWLKRNPKPL